MGFSPLKWWLDSLLHSHSQAPTPGLDDHMPRGLSWEPLTERRVVALTQGPVLGRNQPCPVLPSLYHHVSLVLQKSLSNYVREYIFVLKIAAKLKDSAFCWSRTSKCFNLKFLQTRRREITVWNSMSHGFV